MNAVEKYLNGDYKDWANPWDHSAANFLILTETENEVTTQTLSGACHNTVRVSIPRDGHSYCLTATANRAYSAGEVEFFRWLLQNSPWADLFPVKDPEFSLENGLLVDLEAPGTRVLGALQLSRLTTSEFKESIKLIGSIIELEFNISYHWVAAMVLSGQLVEQNGELRVKSQRYWSDHLPWSGTYLSMPSLLTAMLHGTLNFPSTTERLLKETLSWSLSSEKLEPTSEAKQSVISKKKLWDALRSGDPTRLDGGSSESYDCPWSASSMLVFRKTYSSNMPGNTDGNPCNLLAVEQLLNEGN